MSWESSIKEFKYYLQIERSLAQNSVEAYIRDINKLATYCSKINKSEIKIVDSCTANGIPFVNVSGIGFDAHIAYLFANLTKRGFTNYIKLIYNGCCVLKLNNLCPYKSNFSISILLRK